MTVMATRQGLIIMQECKKKNDMYKCSCLFRNSVTNWERFVKEGRVVFLYSVYRDE